MYIKTKEFNLTDKEFRQLLAYHYFKKIKNLIIFFSILTLISLVVSILSRDYFLTILFLGLLAYYVSIPRFMNLQKTQSKMIFCQRYCEIDDKFISFVYEDGSLVKLNFDTFTQVIRESNYYLLYTTYVKTQFHYLPVAAFNSEQDISRFELLMEGKKLIKLW